MFGTAGHRRALVLTPVLALVLACTTAAVAPVAADATKPEEHHP